MRLTSVQTQTLAMWTLSALLPRLAFSSIRLEGWLVIRLETTTGIMRHRGEVAFFEEHCDLFFGSYVPVDITDVTSMLIEQKFTPLPRRDEVRLLQDGSTTQGVLYATTSVMANAPEPVGNFSAILQVIVAANSDWFYISLNDLAYSLNITLFQDASIISALEVGAYPTTPAPSPVDPPRPATAAPMETLSPIHPEATMEALSPTVPPSSVPSMVPVAAIPKPGAMDDAAFESAINIPIQIPSHAGRGETTSVLDWPLRGSLTINRDGSITYVPRTGFVGVDSFNLDSKQHEPHSVSLQDESQRTVVQRLCHHPPSWWYLLFLQQCYRKGDAQICDLYRIDCGPRNHFRWQS
jgi:hypothetical protein